MAVMQIKPVVRQSGSKGRKSGGGLGQVIGTVGGLAAGAALAGMTGGAAAPGLASLAAAKGAALGGSLGGTVGGIAGGAIDPGKADTRQQEVAPNAPLPASQEAVRSQQLLAAVQAANRTPGMGKFTSPLTQGYIQSMINLKKMG